MVRASPGSPACAPSRAGRVHPRPAVPLGSKGPPHRHLPSQRLAVHRGPFEREFALCPCALAQARARLGKGGPDRGAAREARGARGFFRGGARGQGRGGFRGGLRREAHGWPRPRHGAMLRREPREVALRLLLRARQGGGARRASAPIRLERVENASLGLGEAFSARKRLKRTLGGALLAYDGAGAPLLATRSRCAAAAGSGQWAPPNPHCRSSARDRFPRKSE